MPKMPCFGVGSSRASGGVAAVHAAISAALSQAQGQAQALANARGDGAVDTVVLFASARHADPRPLVAAAQGAARGAHVIGCSASGVLTGAGEMEDGAAVVAMALGGLDIVRFHGVSTPADLSARVREARGALAVLFADGYSQHPDALATSFAAALPGCTLVGGLATGPSGAFPAYRWLDGEVSAQGLSGLVVPGDWIVEVAQGCVPVGPELTVTAGDGKLVSRLDDRPAFAAFAERARPLLDDLRRAAQSVFVAVPDGDDYVVRGILALEPDRGLLVVSDPLPVGTRIRFALREPYAAREALRAALERVRRRLAGRTPRLGFYFDCAGRGRGLFGVEDHDIAHIHGVLGSFPLAGMFGGGELGPAGGGARLHLFSGVLAVMLG
jgi:small ligand-binding sensory domain FIST